MNLTLEDLDHHGTTDVSSQGPLVPCVYVAVMSLWKVTLADLGWQEHCV